MFLPTFQLVECLTQFIEAIGERFRPIVTMEPESIKCPYCGAHMPASWESLYTFAQNGDERKGFTHVVRGQQFQAYKYEFDWMACYNDGCREVIVRVKKRLFDFRSETTLDEEAWYAVPRKRAPRSVDPRIPEEFAKPYIRASLILDDAPDMSGVLSRRILQDLLEKYAGRTEYKLEERIDRFIEDTAHPSDITDNLHHLREIGNFGAHSKKNKESGEFVEIGLEEAEWTLEVIDGLFDYFIVRPQKNLERREAWNKKRGPVNLAAKKPSNG